MPRQYVTQVTALGGRSGAAASADGRLRVALSVPSEMEGDGGPGTNPEQLFAAGFASSFLAAIYEVANDLGVAVAHDSNVTATIAIRPLDPNRLSVDLSIDLPNSNPQEAAKIAALARRRCTLSQMICKDVDVRIAIS